jgi:hypothetical protein
VSDVQQIIPLFVILYVLCLDRLPIMFTIDNSYGLMQSMGNLGPGNMLGLTSSESYATPIRYEITFAIYLGALMGMIVGRAMVSLPLSAKPVLPLALRPLRLFRSISARSTAGFISS